MTRRLFKKKNKKKEKSLISLLHKQSRISKNRWMNKVKKGFIKVGKMRCKIIYLKKIINF